MEAPRKRTTKEKQKWTSFSDLPSHIHMEILCRLPIKTLVATKSVCKSWLHLINDPNFAKLHHARANFEVCCHSNLTCRGGTTKLYMGSFHLLNDSRFFDMKLNTLLELPNFSVKSDNTLNYHVGRLGRYSVNECNGLFCYVGVSYKFAVIWNPITSEFITFPAPKREKGFSNCCVYGLGFSQKANRFKLLRIISRKEKESSEEMLVAEICRIEKGCSWRCLGTCPYPIWKSHGVVNEFTTFLCGALHWFVAYRLDMVIVSFDFENEKFGKVPLPPDSRIMNIDYARIGALAGCLSLTDIRGESCNIWLMQEYGVQDSWTLAISLRLTTPERYKYNRFIPINYLDNGELLVVQDSGLVLYNPLLKSKQDIVIGGHHFTAVAYHPNLVMLKDSMMAYTVHVISRCAGLERSATTLSWWNWKPLDNVITKLQQTQISEDQTPKLMDARLDCHAPAVEDSHNESSNEKSCTKSERLCGDGSSSVPPLSTTMMREEYEVSLKEMREHFEGQLRETQEKLHESLQNYEDKLHESQQNQKETLREDFARISAYLQGEIARISAKLREEIASISATL